jgi:hypothetical protein
MSFYVENLTTHQIPPLYSTEAKRRVPKTPESKNKVGIEGVRIYPNGISIEFDRVLSSDEVFEAGTKIADALNKAIIVKFPGNQDFEFGFEFNLGSGDKIFLEFIVRGSASQLKGSRPFTLKPDNVDQLEDLVRQTLQKLTGKTLKERHDPSIIFQQEGIMVKNPFENRAAIKAARIAFPNSKKNSKIIV